MTAKWPFSDEFRVETGYYFCLCSQHIAKALSGTVSYGTTVTTTDPTAALSPSVAAVNHQ